MSETSSMAMLFLTCSKVVMPIKLLALTISHMLVIDGYMPPGTQWYTSVHKQFKKKFLNSFFLKKPMMRVMFVLRSWNTSVDLRFVLQK